jgi:hypothetical protein
MRAIIRMGVASPNSFREMMLRVSGATAATTFAVRCAMISCWPRLLRVLLPACQGPALRVWRGDSAWDRRRRTYRLSWSRQFEVADDVRARYLAEVRWRKRGARDRSATRGGDLHMEGTSRGGEEEVLVHRRRLSAVRVVARYDQRPL